MAVLIMIQLIWPPSNIELKKKKLIGSFILLIQGKNSILSWYLLELKLPDILILTRLKLITWVSDQYSKNQKKKKKKNKRQKKRIIRLKKKTKKIFKRRKKSNLRKKHLRKKRLKRSRLEKEKVLNLWSCLMRQRQELRKYLLKE